jgi:hypothetical protein
MNLENFKNLNKFHDFSTKNNHFWMRARFNELIKIFKYKSIKIGKNEKILDVGAGKGFFARQLFDKFTLKIDLNDFKKVLSKKNIYKYKCKKIYHGNFLKVKFRKKYDKIFLLDVIEHLNNKDLNYFFLKINDILNNDGLVIINVPSLSFLYSKYDRAVGHYKRYHVNDFVDLSNKFQFKIINVTYWGLFYIPILLLRKFYLFFLPSKKKVDHCFAIKNELLNYLLFKLYLLDSFFREVPYGTSIICLLKKKSK